MLIFQLHCSVCKGCFGNKSKWLAHLLQEGHQIPAREELLNWKDTEKSSTLVVLGELPVGNDDEIIQYFSNVSGKLVTDFVWWPERPRVGFVQFQSSRHAKEALDSLEGHQFQLHSGQFCEVKEGGSLSKLEWKILLPEVVNLTKPQTPAQKLQCISPLIATSLTDGVLTDNCSLKRDQSESPQPPVGRLSSLNAPKTCKTLGFQHHLRAIQKLIEIPDEEYDVAEDILKRLQGAIAKGGKDYQKNLFKAAMSRNWTLKLQYTLTRKDKNPDLSILFYGHTNNTDLRTTGLGAIRMKQLLEIDKQFLRQGKETNGTKGFLSYDVIFVDSQPVTKNVDWGFLHYVIRNPNTGRRFDLTITTNPFFFVEVQVWRLVKYLCTFDPHCYPLLSLAYYWAKTNFVLVGNIHGKSCDLADPHGLNWLMMLFLQQEGLIPSPKIILVQAHKAELFSGADIGFSEDAEMAISWRMKNNRNNNVDGEVLAEEVFTLLYKFFRFCVTKVGNGKRWILDTRNGKIIDDSSNDLARGKSDKVSMFHPLMVNWKISTGNADKAFKAMRETGMRLKDYFGRKEVERMEFDQLLSLLKNKDQE